MQQKRIFISTRAENDSSELMKLCGNAHTLLEFPLIKTERVEVAAHESENFGTYDWIIFTSAYGVKYFHQLCKGMLPKHIKTAAIGKKTAGTLKNLFGKVDYESRSIDSSIFADELKKLWHGTHVKALWPTSVPAKAKLPEMLSDVCSVHRMNIYNTCLPSTIDEAVKQTIINAAYDLIFFYSSSAVENFKFIFADTLDCSAVKAACIGRITARTCRDIGIEPLLTASLPASENLFYESNKFLDTHNKTIKNGIS